MRKQFKSFLDRLKPNMAYMAGAPRPQGGVAAVPGTDVIVNPDPTPTVTAPQGSGASTLGSINTFIDRFVNQGAFPGLNLTPSIKNSIISRLLETIPLDQEYEGINSPQTGVMQSGADMWYNLAVQDGNNTRQNHQKKVIEAVKEAYAEARYGVSLDKLPPELQGITSSGSVASTIEAFKAGAISIEKTRGILLRSIYDSQFMSDTGRLPTEEESQAFVDAHAGDSLGFSAIPTGAEGEDIEGMLDEVTNTVSEEIQSNPAVAEEKAQNVQNIADNSPLSIKEIQEIKKDALSELAGKLESGVAAREETLRGALDKYVSTIAGQPEKLRSILEERLARDRAALPRELGEEFTAGVGLKTGAFQKTFAEELAQGRTELESSIAEYELGQQGDIAQRRLGLAESLANIREGDVRRLGELGADIDFQGAQLGREDFLNQLQFNQTQQLNAQQNDVNFYLNRLGFLQNQSVAASQFAQQSQMLGQQQSFQASQNALTRQLSERQFNQQIQEARTLQNQQSRDANTGALVSGIAGVAGSVFGGPIGGALAKNIFSPQTPNTYNSNPNLNLRGY